MRAAFYAVETTGTVDPEQIQGKAAVFAEREDHATVNDTLILCRFYQDLYPWDRLSKLIGDVTGLEPGEAQIRSIAGDGSHRLTTNEIGNYSRYGIVLRDRRREARLSGGPQTYAQEGAGDVWHIAAGGCCSDNYLLTRKEGRFK